MTLTATNANGSTTFTLEQIVRVPAISLHAGRTGGADSRSTSVDASPPELGLVAWSWTFGDGTTSIFQNPVQDVPPRPARTRSR